MLTWAGANGKHRGRLILPSKAPGGPVANSAVLGADFPARREFWAMPWAAAGRLTPRRSPRQPFASRIVYATIKALGRAGGVAKPPAKRTRRVARLLCLSTVPARFGPTIGRQTLMADVDPSREIPARLHLLADRLERESTKWRPLRELEKDYDKYQREAAASEAMPSAPRWLPAGCSWRQSAAARFLRIRRMQELVRHWDYPNEAQRNNAVFLAVSQKWLPTRHPTFQFQQDSFNLAQAYSDAMRLFAEELDAAAGSAAPSDIECSGKCRRNRPGPPSEIHGDGGGRGTQEQARG